MSQEKIFHLQGHGRRGGDDALGCQQGTSGVLPRRRRAPGARDPGLLLRQPVRQSGQCAGARGDHRARDLGADGARAATPWCAASAPAARSPGSRTTSRAPRRSVDMVLADPAGSVLAHFATTGTAAGEDDAVAGRRDRRGFRAAGGGFLARRPPPTASRDAEAFRTCRELLAREGIIAGTSTGTLLAAALRYCREQRAAEARGDLRLRQRQQVPLQGLQRLLDARSGIPRARAPRRSARSHRAAARRARRGHGELHRDA